MRNLLVLALLTALFFVTGCVRDPTANDMVAAKQVMAGLPSQCAVLSTSRSGGTAMDPEHKIYFDIVCISDATPTPTTTGQQ